MKTIAGDQSDGLVGVLAMVRELSMAAPGAQFSSVPVDQFASAQSASNARSEQSYVAVQLVTPSSRSTLTAIISGNGRTIIPIPVVSPNSWGIPTGTVSRATFDQSSVTLAQLAQRLAALIQDLQTIGILPAGS